MLYSHWWQQELLCRVTQKYKQFSAKNVEQFFLFNFNWYFCQQYKKMPSSCTTICILLLAHKPNRYWGIYGERFLRESHWNKWTSSEELSSFSHLLFKTSINKTTSVIIFSNHLRFFPAKKYLLHLRRNFRTNAIIFKINFLVIKKTCCWLLASWT